MIEKVERTSHVSLTERIIGRWAQFSSQADPGWVGRGQLLQRGECRFMESGLAVVGGSQSSGTRSNHRGLAAVAASQQSSGARCSSRGFVASRGLVAVGGSQSSENCSKCRIAQMDQNASKTSLLKD